MKMPVFVQICIYYHENIVCTGSTISLEYNLDMEKGTLCFGMPSKGGCAFSVLWVLLNQ